MFIEHTRELRDYHGAVRSNLIGTHRSTLVQNGLNVLVSQEIFFDFWSHFLQTDEVRICIFDYLQHGVQSFLNYLLEPDVVS